MGLKKKDVLDTIKECNIWVIKQNTFL
jgi:hypothetical protein